MQRKFLLLLVISTLFSLNSFAQSNGLKVPPENIVIKARTDGSGFDMYIKKTPEINSVLLTESIKDASGNNDTYAYRALEYNPVNGDEVRYLFGQPLDSEMSKFSLVDSTPEKTDFFDEAFHIYIPNKVVFGYPWSRFGQVEVGNKTFINIRTFEKKYADHSGNFADSPFYMNLMVIEKVKKPEPKEVAPVAVKEPEYVEEILVKPDEEPVPPKKTVDEEYIASHYNQTASNMLSEISDEIVYCKGPSSLVSDIEKILSKIKNKGNLDVVFAIDGTGSMDDDLYVLKHELIPSLEHMFNKTGATFGLLYYRDYDDFVASPYKGLPVRLFDCGTDLGNFYSNLNSITAYGGGDVPEAVYEAIFAAIDGFNWREGSEKRIILIGDAEPHPEPRGSGLYSKEYVMGLANEKGINVTTILLP